MEIQAVKETWLPAYPGSINCLQDPLLHLHPPSTYKSIKIKPRVKVNIKVKAKSQKDNKIKIFSA